MTLNTPFLAEHQRLGAKMAPFAGWNMPLHYGSQLTEHQAVRSNVGMFDVSHMGQFSVQGQRAAELLLRYATCDVSKLVDGQARYGMACLDDGGILDDLIITRLAADHYFIVVNAGRIAEDFARLLEVRERHGFSDVGVRNESPEWAMIAVQGPRAAEVLGGLAGFADASWTTSLRYFHVVPVAYAGAAGYASRTGYTGEDGFEVILPAEAGLELWAALLAAGVQPCGLAARDTLRLEAGYLLNGNDMSPANNPFEMGAGWCVQLDRATPPEGAEALRAAKANPHGRRFVGLELEGRGIPRHGLAVALVAGEGAEPRRVGEVTSGTFSPTLQKGIALALVEGAAVEAARAGAGRLAIVIREVAMPARVVKPPFVKETSLKR